MKRLAVAVLAGFILGAPAAPVFADLVTRPDAVGPRDFRNAKKVLPRVYRGLEQDFYCGCPYTGKEMDLKSCGYQPRKQQTRAERLEWEHVVPAWVLGHQRMCWQEKVKGKSGGRKNCTDNDPVFARAEGDLINLVPSVGEVNGDRQNFRFSIWTDKPTPMYGQCQTVVDFKERRVQPRKEVRGRIARIQFYMAARYDLKLSREDQRIFCAWARAYPVDAWERQRDERIVKLQGNGNPFVSDAGAITKVCGQT